MIVNQLFSALKDTTTNLASRWEYVSWWFSTHFSPCTSILECKSKCNFLNIKTRVQKLSKNRIFYSEKVQKRLCNRGWNQSCFVIRFWAVFVSFTVGHYGITMGWRTCRVLGEYIGGLSCCLPCNLSSNTTHSRLLYHRWYRLFLLFYPKLIV